MRATNSIAEKLIAKANAVGLEIAAGYFATSTYCVGVRVRDAAHAFAVGALLGNGYGPVSLDAWPGEARAVTLAFPDARVQA